MFARYFFRSRDEEFSFSTKNLKKMTQPYISSELALTPQNINTSNDTTSYIDSELSSIRSRIKNLATNLENINNQIKSKDAHLVSNAYHMSSVESNTNNALFDIKSRLSALENANTNNIRDLASVNSVVSVVRQDQQRLLSSQNEANRSNETKLHEISANMRDKSSQNQLSETRNFDDLNHRINQIESSLNNKFDTLSLKFTNQLQNLERLITDERRSTNEMVTSSLTRFENRINENLKIEASKTSNNINKVVDNAKLTEENIDWIIERLKSNESKTSKRLRSFNEDYQKDMKTLTDSINAVTELNESKVNLVRENIKNELLAIKKLII